jgi:hypothetical protein
METNRFLFLLTGDRSEAPDSFVIAFTHQAPQLDTVSFAGSFLRRPEPLSHPQVLAAGSFCNNVGSQSMSRNSSVAHSTQEPVLQRHMRFQLRQHSQQIVQKQT